MQKMSSKISQNEREIKKRKIERVKLEKKVNQFKETEKELTERKKMIFRERRKLTEEERKIKWRLEELKRTESRAIPEINKIGKEIQKCKVSLSRHKTDLFNLQGETMKLKRGYRQLLKKRQEIERKGGKI